MFGKFVQRFWTRSGRIGGIASADAEGRVELGVLEKVWPVLVEECGELGGVEWEWQAAACVMGKARFGGIQSAPTSRTGPRQAASGVSYVDGSGGPLSVVVAGANVHDTRLLRQTLDDIVVARPGGLGKDTENLCLDKGYDNPTGRAAATDRGYRAHIRRIG